MAPSEPLFIRFSFFIHIAVWDACVIWLTNIHFAKSSFTINNISLYTVNTVSIRLSSSTVIWKKLADVAFIKIITINALDTDFVAIFLPFANPFFIFISISILSASIDRTAYVGITFACCCVSSIAISTFNTIPRFEIDNDTIFRNALTNMLFVKIKSNLALKTNLLTFLLLFIKPSSKIVFVTKFEAMAVKFTDISSFVQCISI